MHIDEGFDLALCKETLELLALVLFDKEKAQHTKSSSATSNTVQSKKVMANFCGKCGTKLGKGDNFCGKCGEKV